METKNEIAEYNSAFDEEIINIIIITGASSFSAAQQLGNEELWTAHIKVTAWKLTDSEEINCGEYSLVTKADDDYLRHLQEKTLPNSIISVKVRRKDNEFLLVEFSDDECKNLLLEKILKEQKKPVLYRDPFLGKFVLDKNLDLFEGKIKWRNKKIDMTVPKYPEKRLKDAFVTVNTLLKKQIVWDEKLKRFAANKLLKLKNTSWLNENEPQITLPEFVRRIKTEHIEVYPKGRFEFWFNDGDVFGGHAIVVSGSLEKGPSKATVE
ncbi:MAG: DUF2262 domain-containing protein [Flavobacteriaceae bacterium]|jgi:hypothetical protein|nr:DUF2262 domain-containing protein [Flavobacteriaceae bacterium]